MPSRSRRIGRGLDVVLGVAAVLGLVVLLARAAGAALGLELVTFETGSMSPAFPQGSVAVAQRVAAEDLRIGDVVTLDRAGRLPITHRVVAVDRDAGRVVLRLRGDDNREPDPEPYVVSRPPARVVVGLPAFLSVLTLTGTPQGAGAATVLATVSVIWGLWPRTRRTADAAPGLPAT